MIQREHFEIHVQDVAGHAIESISHHVLEHMHDIYPAKIIT